MTVTEETVTAGKTANGTFVAPGQPGSVVDGEAPLRELHRRALGGPGQGPVHEEHQPGHRPALHRGGQVHARGRGARPRRRPRRQGCLGRDLARRAGRRAQRHRRRHRGQPDHAGRGRELGERQAGARDAGRGHPAGRRPLPVLRRCHPVARGPLHRDRQGHRRLPLPRAPRRGGPDHPVQLPAPHGGVEDRPGPGRRQLHRGQAGVAHAVVDPEAGRGDRRTSCPPAWSTS